MLYGGALVAQALHREGVQNIFTLTGGHISPILVEAKRLGVRVIDARHEATAVFAADATARLTGIPGVAAVTAGPGVTNTITAIKNAQMAQSPLILLGGAAATILKGRGSLQDIEQITLMKSLVKWSVSIKQVKHIPAALHSAFMMAQHGVPGPVFVELPIDTLYPEALVRSWYMSKQEEKFTWSKWRQFNIVRYAEQTYIRYHLHRVFSPPTAENQHIQQTPHTPLPSPALATKAMQSIENAQRPVMVIGSQAVVNPARIPELIASIEALGIPVYLSGMARGLLGVSHPLLFRHKRKEALRASDCVVLLGVPNDFRLDYGKSISAKAILITANRSRRDVTLNRKPTIGVHGDPAQFASLLSAAGGGTAQWSAWFVELRSREQSREKDIAAQALAETQYCNPLALCSVINGYLDTHSIVVADGGDFVGTAAYTIHPHTPLSWLDPGVFGTLGVGAGFALGIKAVRPDAEVWILYGDGSAGYSLQEFDTFVRHGMGVIAVIGNDGGWTQIARDQVEILGDDVATLLRRNEYHSIAQAWGGAGALLDHPNLMHGVLAQAKKSARQHIPFCINAWISPGDFRKGSISV
jgi:acetolactate synthase-like protein